MLAAIQPAHFELQNVLVHPRSHNNVVHGTYFHRFQLNHKGGLLTGIYLVLNLSHTRRENSFSGNKLEFSVGNNRDLISQMEHIERGLLSLVGSELKTGSLALVEALQTGSLKLCEQSSSNNSVVLLRISGIWEDETNYGLVFRFIQPSRLL